MTPAAEKGRRVRSSALFERDLPAEHLKAARRRGKVAWDIETTGLDWRTDRIGTCQLYAPEAQPIIVRIGSGTPSRLAQLLTDDSVTKLFHHAMFDLRFMSYAWDVEPRSIACTKVAAKVLQCDEPEATTSLKELLRMYLGAELDKDQQLSDWTATEFSAEQLAYAAADVVHLLELLKCLEADLEKKSRLELAKACYAHIPIRVKLDLLGLPDVYTY